jgi:hypothetical protein
MLTFTILLNLVACAYVTGAFVLQMTVHFPFMDESYWEDNLKYTAYWFVVPLIVEISTAWSALEQTWYPVATILLVLGWVLNIPVWYYQIKLAGGEATSYGTGGATVDALIHLSRARGCVWIARLAILMVWCSLNM